MITLKEAIKRAEKWRGRKVVSIRDCGDRWVFNFEHDEQGTWDSRIPDFAKEVLASVDYPEPVFSFKDDGHCEFFFISENLDLLSKGRNILAS